MFAKWPLLPQSNSFTQEIFHKNCVPDVMGIHTKNGLWCHHIKLNLKLPGGNGGLNGSGGAEGFSESDPEAFQSTLSQNKATARGGRRIWPKLGGLATVLAPPETGLAVIVRVISSPGGKQLRSIRNAPILVVSSLGVSLKNISGNQMKICRAKRARNIPQREKKVLVRAQPLPHYADTFPTTLKGSTTNI